MDLNCLERNVWELLSDSYRLLICRGISFKSHCSMNFYSWKKKNIDTWTRYRYFEVHIWYRKYRYSGIDIPTISCYSAVEGKRFVIRYFKYWVKEFSIESSEDWIFREFSLFMDLKIFLRDRTSNIDFSSIWC